MSARTLGPGSLSIGPAGTPKQFAGDVTKISVAPSTDSEDDIPLLDGSNETGEDTTSWALNGTILDKYTLTSLSVWCAQEAGKEHPFLFTPSDDADADLEVGGVVKIRAVAIGGEVKKKNTNDFEFAIVGDPTFSSNV